MKASLATNRLARLLWILTVLFCLRVLGQVLVEFFQVPFLPPSAEWFSGMLAYPQLLASQILIIALQVLINVNFTSRTGLSYRPRRWVGQWLLSFGAIYLTVMIIRYAIRMGLYPHERWTGGSIPIFFHWVLSTYVLLIGFHHWREGRFTQNNVASPAYRRWIFRCLKITGWSSVGSAVVVWIVYLLLPSLLAEYIGIRRSEFAVRIERGVPLTTADGTTLVADIYHPVRAGAKTPTVLVRIPYSKTNQITLFATTIGSMWAERGYTVVLQGTRGRYDSGGSYDPLVHERQDGLDTLMWLSRQPWYDGRLGMWGVSYYGYTQWVLADQKHPGPTALIIQESTSDTHGMFYPGGAFSLRTALYWAAMSYGRTDIVPTPEAMRRGITGFPLIAADDRAVQDIPFFNDWASHTERDEYWAGIDGADRPSRLQAPVLLLGGWYDPFLPTQLADYARIRESAAPHVAQETRLVIGPWIHAAAATLPDGTEPRNFRLECLAPTVAWFDRHLQHQESTMAPVRIYTIGTNQWRDEQEWPLARTRYTPYYLQSNGPANTAAGQGMLTTSRPLQDQPADSFIYDPHDPVPSVGGTMLGSDAGTAPQFAVEARDDVLVYSTAPLPSDLEVTGPIKLILHVATTASCTDFTGKLVDVFPDGSAWNVSEGILRRTFAQPANTRNTEITVEMWPTSTIFKKGHRLRLEVSSSNYPRFDRNPNTGQHIPTETSPVPATQTVFHDSTAPSRLILPIIPQAAN